MRRAIRVAAPRAGRPFHHTVTVVRAAITKPEREQPIPSASEQRAARQFLVGNKSQPRRTEQALVDRTRGPDIGLARYRYRAPEVLLHQEPGIERIRGVVNELLVLEKAAQHLLPLRSLENLLVAGLEGLVNRIHAAVGQHHTVERSACLHLELLVQFGLEALQL